jgi:hypothetical protein
MASESELRDKYRASRLENCLECDAAKATKMAKGLAYLSDEDFDRYANHSAEAVAALKSRAGVTVAPTKPTPRPADAEKVRAAVAEFVAGEFFDVGEDEDRR